MNDVTINEVLNYNSVTIIDIRNKVEYDLGHIPNSICIPFKDLLINYSTYLKKDGKYYLYCQNGYSSHDLAVRFNTLGYNTKSIIGGYDNYLQNK